MPSKTHKITNTINIIINTRQTHTHTHPHFSPVTMEIFTYSRVEYEIL